MSLASSPLQGKVSHKRLAKVHNTEIICQRPQNMQEYSTLESANVFILIIQHNERDRMGGKSLKNVLNVHFD